MIPGRLQLRFVVAAGLLVLTTVTASVWTFFALTRLSRVASDTVEQSESVTAVTSRLAGALEREDDAVLLIVAGDRRGRQALANERSVVDNVVADLIDVLGPEDERELASPLQAELRAYRQAADAIVSVPGRETLVQYHQKANPVLRRAVALTTAIRDRHFELARRAVAGVRDQAAAARQAVLLITLTALGIAVAVAWHLTRTVVGPVRQLTRGAEAIRKGDFSERIDIASRDELGELAATFNQMAEDLLEFRRTNIGEVVRAKTALEATLEHHHSDAGPGARGAGIGLYMCRQIVELHGGEISCGAGSDGGGTCITVKLPARSMTAAAVASDTATCVSS
jgi:nitrogen fixation/metabolism regulation signal transduction histidine kinase